MFTNIPGIPIFMVGAGNVAWHLGAALKTSGLPVSRVWSRDIRNAEELADKLSCKATDSIEDIIHFDGIILFCIPDHVIPFFVSQIQQTNSIIIHTSGSLPISVFGKQASQVGVFYPLQTFTKAKPDRDFRNVPVLIESSTPLVEEILTLWSKHIGSSAYHLNSPQRMRMHIAAIFSCNFTNHMVSIAQEIAKENKLNVDLLKPLITETLTNLMHFDPKKMQTGPALRKDFDTMQKHKNLLSPHPDYAKIYSFVSDSIIKMHIED